MAAARVPERRYARWFDELPARNQQQMADRWGPPPGESYVHDGHIALAGLQLRQRLRRHPAAARLRHGPEPDLPPAGPAADAQLPRAVPLAARRRCGADAIVHVGKHGTLEWLPGKARRPVARRAIPDLLLGDLPLVYPFIINDPGEGAQAKRRAHAVIVDHLTPPMTTADAYGKLDELARLVDEYYQVEALDPSKLPHAAAADLGAGRRGPARRRHHLMIQQLNQQGDHTHDWDPQVTEDGTPVTLAEMRSQGLRPPDREPGRLFVRAGQRADPRRAAHARRALRRRAAARPGAGAWCACRTWTCRACARAWPTAFGLGLDELLDDLGARLAADSTGVRAWRARPDADAGHRQPMRWRRIDALVRAAGRAPAGCDVASPRAPIDGRRPRRARTPTRTPQRCCDTLRVHRRAADPEPATLGHDEIGNLLRALDGALRARRAERRADARHGPRAADRAQLLRHRSAHHAQPARPGASASSWPTSCVERHRRETGALSRRASA